jgi:hypothetical protein
MTAFLKAGHTCTVAFLQVDSACSSGRLIIISDTGISTQTLSLSLCLTYFTVLIKLIKRNVPGYKLLT